MGGRQLWMWLWTFGFPKKWELSWQVENLLALQAGLCSIVSVNWLISYNSFIAWLHFASVWFSIISSHDSLNFYLLFTCPLKNKTLYTS
jgi:hypothetical protein